ncbi:unnamed protein product [Allacma fusca]|uniref:G-protein coupled receptors family 1 profile domain-containing protein n=1 Tax=Allacma fusca TaxID=39272 RepID=A0A8J2NXN4_9HEXA|nr:unnamed protein product [Allacma fusca]
MSSQELLGSSSPMESEEARLFNKTLSIMMNMTDYNVTLNETDYENEGGFSQSPLPWLSQLFWSVLFGAIVVVATVGNLIVIWIVLAHKRMRTVTNYLLVNLSIADAMVSTLNVIPNYIYMVTNHWPFGWLYCKIVQFVAVLSICASVFSLMAIAFDSVIRFGAKGIAINDPPYQSQVTAVSLLSPI